MHSVHDGNLALVNLEDNNIADGKMLRLHPQKKNVASTKRRLHTATENNYNRAFAVAN
jgi:hypothetical protein